MTSWLIILRTIVVFPGGMLPTLSLLVDTMAKGASGRLVVDAVSNIGPHYARTLREWRSRFDNNFTDSIVPGELLMASLVGLEILNGRRSVEGRIS